MITILVASKDFLETHYSKPNGESSENYSFSKHLVNFLRKRSIWWNSEFYKSRKFTIFFQEKRKL
jgi:hypothetical protein